MGQGRAWAQREGVEVGVDRYDRLRSDPPEADIWIVAAAEMPRWAAAGQLQPVPTAYVSESAYGWNNLLPYYRDRLLTWNNQAYALPLLGESPLCFYRADLFAVPEHREAFRKKTGAVLAPPATWGDFAVVAEFFAKQLGQPSLPPLPADDEQLDQEFHAVAAPFVRRGVPVDEDRRTRESDVAAFSFHYDLKTGQLRLQTPGFVHALQLLQRLQECRPAGDHPVPAAVFRDGGAVLCLADASWIGRFQEAFRQAKGPRLGICRLPGSRQYFTYEGDEARLAPGVNRVPYLGSACWLAVVPATAKHPDTAFALLAYLSGREISRQYVLAPESGGGGAFRADHLDTPSAWLNFDVDAEQNQELVNSLRQTLVDTGIKNPLLRLRTPDQRAHMQALAADVRAALLKGAPAADALAAAARRWQELDREQPEAERKNAYLLNLSLHGER
jgi:ABC-type glycerol-3-phosphate transport system substrate-binding protein